MTSTNQRCEIVWRAMQNEPEGGEEFSVKNDPSHPAFLLLGQFPVTNFRRALKVFSPSRSALIDARGFLSSMLLALYQLT